MLRHTRRRPTLPFLCLAAILLPMSASARGARHPIPAVQQTQTSGPQLTVQPVTPIVFAGGDAMLRLSGPTGWQTLATGDVVVRLDSVVVSASRPDAATIRFTVPTSADTLPLIEVTLGRLSAEPMRGLLVLPRVTGAVPDSAPIGQSIALVTSGPIPASVRPNVSVLLGGARIDSVEFSGAGLSVVLPERDTGAVTLTYEVAGVAGTAGPSTLRVLAQPASRDWIGTAFGFIAAAIIALLLFERWFSARRNERTASLHPAREQLAALEAATGAGAGGTAFPAVSSVGSTPRPPITLPPTEGPITLERIVVENFKNIRRLELNLDADSSLGGRWTCVAGINGSGKSSLLQAICIVLLGDKLAAELGSTRLKRMLRREGSSRLDASVEVWVRRGDQTARLLIRLDKEGVAGEALQSDPEYQRMRLWWDQLRSSVLVSYGATRNLSDREERSHDYLAEQTQRQMTLFDPLTRITGVNVLLESGKHDSEADRKTLETLHRLLTVVLSGETLPFDYSRRRDRLEFAHGSARLDAIDLPDGFRSTVAWLADLCTAWHATAPDGRERGTDPSEITGIVLIDEIDLHLHPSLARSIVPSLRAALPQVQFIVTTHSPLVLSSFDRSELIILESDPTGEVGVRELDRQLFGFTMDEVYRWLMRTPPSSAVLEQKAESGDDPKFAEYLFQTGGAAMESEGINEEGAKKLMMEMEVLLRELDGHGGKS